MVISQPTIHIPVSYAVARGNTELLEAVNARLLVEQSRGTVGSLYDYWMLGGATKTEGPARWSIIRDVLGWVD